MSLLSRTFAFSILLSATAACLAADDGADALSGDDKQKAADFDKATLLANKEAAAINAKTALAKAKTDAATPATAAGVTPLSGAVTGANNMTFAMYVVSLDSLRQVAQAVCDDLAGRDIRQVFVTGKDVAEAVAKEAALDRGRRQLSQKLDAARGEAARMADIVAGKAEQPKISAATLTAVASGIDIAAGLLKGVAGLASIFKSERTIEASDNLLTAAEVSASLSMCGSAAAPAKPAPAIRNVDADLVALARAVDQVSNEVKMVSDGAAALDKALTTLAEARAARDREQAAAEAVIADPKAKAADVVAARDVAAARAGRRLVNEQAFVEKATALATTAQAAVDATYQVDAATSLSPLIVTAQFRVVRDAAMAADGRRLVLTLLRSSGYSLTTKRLFLNDRVDYAGGVAIRAAVYDVAGTAVYERIFFRDSGWIRADFKPSGSAVQRQNF